LKSFQWSVESLQWSLKSFQWAIFNASMAFLAFHIPQVARQK
jgi:hypothetical protein